MSEPKQSETPRTDAAELDLIRNHPGLDEKRVMSAFDFARELERENQRLREELDEAMPSSPSTS